MSSLEASKISKRQRLKVGERVGSRRLDTESQVISIDDGDSSCRDSKSVKIGEAWSPSEFINRAKRCDHPFAPVHAPDELTKAVFASLTKGVSGIREHQKMFKAKWEARAKELLAEEALFCSKLHPAVAPFCARKRPLLTTEILDSLGFPASDLVLFFLANGFPMFGPFPKTGLFPERHHAASMSYDHLRAAAKWARPALLNSSKFETPKRSPGAALAGDQGRARSRRVPGPILSR